MTLKNNRAPLLCYFKLYASFCSHQWIQVGVTVRKRPIWVKIDDFFSRVTLKFAVWPWKTIGHLFYSTSSFVHHFVTIGVYLSYSPETPNLGQIRRFLEPCDLEIWRMTLKNNRAPLLCYFKLCAAFLGIGEFKLELQAPACPRTCSSWGRKVEHPHSQGLSELRGLAGVHTCTGQLSLKQMSNIDANAGIIITIIPYIISYHIITYHIISYHSSDSSPKPHTSLLYASYIQKTFPEAG